MNDEGDVWLEWGVRTSNGTVRRTENEVEAVVLAQWSQDQGCRPAWRVVSREHHVSRWAEPVRHNHNSHGVYANCPACDTVIPLGA